MTDIQAIYLRDDIFKANKLSGPLMRFVPNNEIYDNNPKNTENHVSLAKVRVYRRQWRTKLKTYAHAH